MFGMLKKLVLLAGLAGGAAVVVKKLMGAKADEQAWESYAPKHTAAPTAAPAEAAQTAPITDDASGATPDEAIADAQAEPHAASTPDAPAEVTEVESQPDTDRL